MNLEKKLAERPTIEELRDPEFQARLEEQAELKRKAQKAAYRTLEEIISSEPKIVEVYVPTLDCKIKVQPITVEDYIKSLKFRDERNEEGVTNYFIHMLRCSWGKCDPTVTEERLRGMSLATLVKIMAAIPIPKMDVSQNPLSRRRLGLPRVPPKAARTS